MTRSLYPVESMPPPSDEDRPLVRAKWRRRSPPVRPDGWTEVRRTQFLQALRCGETVKTACALAGMSRVSAYQLRARDEEFAEAWEAMIIRRHLDLEAIAYERAVNGYDVPIFYRGRQVGVRRHYPDALMLQLIKLNIHRRHHQPIPKRRHKEMTQEQKNAKLMAKIMAVIDKHPPTRK